LIHSDVDVREYHETWVAIASDVTGFGIDAREDLVQDVCNLAM
jgi:hypothetical protein